MSTENDIEVSVLCLVYNHEKTVERCLHSLLNQKTSFKYEVIVHDDCSSDNSVNLIKQLEERYYPKLVPIYQKENQYSKGISITEDIFTQVAKGKYYAICEGDDYWCDENKLQLQFDFMENHPTTSLCTHNTRIHFLNSNRKDTLFNNWDNIHFLDEYDVFKDWKVHTSSYFYRKEYMHRPEFARKYYFGDYTMLTNFFSKGDVVCLPNIMSVYNAGNNNGVVYANYNSGSEKAIKAIVSEKDYLTRFDDFTNGKYHHVISQCISLCDIKLLRQKYNVALQEGNFREVKKISNEIYNHPSFAFYLKGESKKNIIFSTIKYRYCGMYYGYYTFMTFLKSLFLFGYNK